MSKVEGEGTVWRGSGEANVVAEENCPGVAGGKSRWRREKKQERGRASVQKGGHGIFGQTQAAAEKTVRLGKAERARSWTPSGFRGACRTRTCKHRRISARFALLHMIHLYYSPVICVALPTSPPRTQPIPTTRREHRNFPILIIFRLTGRVLSISDM